MRVKLFFTHHNFFDVSLCHGQAIIAWHAFLSDNGYYCGKYSYSEIELLSRLHILTHVVPLLQKKKKQIQVRVGRKRQSQVKNRPADRQTCRQRLAGRQTHRQKQVRKCADKGRQANAQTKVSRQMCRQRQAGRYADKGRQIRRRSQADKCADKVRQADRCTDKVRQVGKSTDKNWQVSKGRRTMAEGGKARLATKIEVSPFPVLGLCKIVLVLFTYKFSFLPDLFL